MPTVRDVLLRIRRELQEAGCDAPDLEAAMIVSHAWWEMLPEDDISPKNRAGMIALGWSEIPPEVDERAGELAWRRATREPLAYILERAEFYGRWFRVTPLTLVPRMDTETLVDVGIALLDDLGRPHGDLPDVLELGTGTGCVIISLLAERPEFRGAGCDISRGALGVTIHNANKHDVINRLVYFQSDWFSGVHGRFRRQFSLIVANPPYIDPAEGPDLQPEVRDFEPPTALFAGEGGMANIRQILGEARNWLKPGGWIAVEVGQGQAEKALELARDFSYAETDAVDDTGGVTRVVCARTPS